MARIIDEHNHRKPSKDQAITLVQEALAMCDKLELTDAAIHLQMGLDLLIGWDRPIQAE